MKKISFIILLTIFIAHLGLRIFQYKNEYLSKYDPGYWEYRYLNSQWVSVNPIESIGDDGLYAHAGYKYITGADPTLINPEAPPLGKYFIGLSILIFDNQNIFALVAGIGSLLLFYLFNMQMYKDKLLAFLPVFIFSLEPLFYQQLRAPYLDSLFLIFLLLTFLTFMKKRFWLTAIFIGCMAGTKFSTLTIVVAAALCIYVLLKKDKRDSKNFLLSLVIAPIIFLLIYARYFLLGHSLIEFLGVQKYIINFYANGAKAAFGIVIPMILTGNWYTWFSGVQRVAEWNVFWPISFVLSSIAIGMQIMKKQINPVTMVSIWIVCYLIFLLFTPVTSRYLLLLLPFMYNLNVWVLSKNIFPRL
jgi:predicted membrane-bound dolichyl-phosphate-mannose-protein mannosyltransferase